MSQSVLRAGLVRVALVLTLFVSMASAQSITTTFAGGNSFNGNMFDVKALTNLTITNFDVNFVGTADFEVWAVTGGGTYLGNQTNPAPWTLLGSATGVVSNGSGVATPLPITTNLLIPAGSIQGIYVTLLAGTMNYTNGTVQGALYASNADIEFYEGHGGGYPFALANVPRVWNGTIYYSLAPTVADDLAVTSISAPVDSVGCDSLSMTESVTATLNNYGMNTVLSGTLVQVDLTVDGSFVTSEFLLLPNDLMTGQSYTFTFVTTVDLSAIGAHTVDVTVVYGGDLDPSNDTASTTVNSGGAAVISSLPWTETFENHATAPFSTVVPTGWTNDPADSGGTYGDWLNEQGTTGSLAGPTVDHTTGTATGWYMYCEDSVGSPNSTAINLITPCIDLTTQLNPVSLSFWHHSDAIIGSTNDNILEIDVLTYPGAVVTTSVATYPSNGPGSDWTNHQLDLSPFLGSTIQLVFRGRNDNGSSFDDDVAIDDVSIYEPVAVFGQAPRPGLAVFDIENAVNANLASVPSGAGGPYFTGVTQGGSFNFHFEGESGQPIAVVYGALNPVSATYPGGIGQFDIGGPGVDPQGIPLNIGVFVNAIAWATAPVGFPLDALFFVGPTGSGDVGFQMPNFGIPGGSVLTTFQSAITSTSAPFVYISNAIEVTIN